MWNVKTIPRHKHLVWRILHDKLPTKHSLFQRGVLQVPLCPRCNATVETSSHIFKDCEWVKRVWFASPMSIRFGEQPLSGKLFKDWLNELINYADPDLLAVVFSFCYGIWYARNKLCFEQVRISIPQLIQQATSSVVEYNLRNSVHLEAAADTEQLGAELQVKWSPPTVNCYKLNVDAAGPVDDNWGAGAIIRNHVGEVMAAGRWKLSCLNDVAVAEALALRTGMQFALDTFLLHVQAETDSSSVAVAFNADSNDNNYMDLVIQYCKNLRNSFSSFHCAHVRRAANQAAHGLARSTLFSSDKVWLEEIPNCISNIVSQEISSLSVD